MEVSPVTFPPGRARLATMRCLTASAESAMTMGIVLVAFFARRAPCPVLVTMTSTLRRTSSAASSASLSMSPSADRYSMAMFLPLDVTELAKPLTEWFQMIRITKIEIPDAGDLACGLLSRGGKANSEEDSADQNTKF